MTASSHHGGGKGHWSALGPEVPADLNGIRVLDVRPGELLDSSSAELSKRGAEKIVCRGPLELGEDMDEKFDLVYCRDSLQADPHPMNLVARLWHLTEANGILLLESQILTAPEQSRHGRFVAAGDDSGSLSHWVPGRLTFRWMVEVSGYDIDRWLPEKAETTGVGSQASAYLRATRTERIPALDLATPARSQ